jgi:acyl-CoA synthetase (AMP-forming)/AMP-acid ligase II
VRNELYGASPIAPEVLRRAIEVFGCDFVQFFGMTETSGCTLLRAADHDPVRFPERLASAGTDTVSFETRVVDAHDVELPPGEVGEIVTRGPAVMTGYWNQPEATADALRNGWMHTGDLGYRAADGYLYVTDRLKDMIVSGGENVYPREVEDVLFEHPDVLDAAVIGVPDERWGERVHAVVCLRPGRALDDAAVQRFCRERLAAYKCPRSVAFVDELPRNVTGKVLKRELRAAHWPVGGRSIG